MTKASNWPAVRRSSSPFVMPLQPHAADGLDVVPREKQGQAYGYLLVKQNAH